MHLLCKVHCRMQCKAATFAMQRERKRVREREGGRDAPHLAPARVGCTRSTTSSDDVVDHRSTRTGCTGQIVATATIRLRAYVGGTDGLVELRNFRRSSPRLRGPHRMERFTNRQSATPPAPTWAAPFPTSAPTLEPYGAGTGWLRSEPTARLCLVPCPDATIAHAPFSAALARRLAHPRVGSTLTVLATRATRAPAHRSWALGESYRPSLFARVRGAAWRR